ncbi:phosphoribosylformylglycinamidine cyclo-ligase [Parasphaerochaeta coccoides]|uniref:Phosphoribosylformylglycinamidine cyclo-ligase n=1 Tax=Parasphaerochaeta coccoides (strain ATCC BAA-1237 / DSM 17374 / SPN1) TaxID=760011 RepID=F4GHW9_PARC1|nr:phosphoribosylformylglycinamidine cyclo-ligase [Parasphaerochaeta coccoides]AEC02082.1 phosphoribosylformylglycinamidine cyclo-ligase [Parasphaerochaeta coccoides DSM 17374]
MKDDSADDNVRETSYKDAGVNIDAGNQAVERIKEHVALTFTPAVLRGLGSFASFFDIKDILKIYANPVMVQSADGVGTKIAIAEMAHDFSTIGEDLVSACANDIVVHGARPYTFLDYIANDTLDPRIVEELVAGMARACKRDGIALVGGETAEMPGTYTRGSHDLVGLITGFVDRKMIVDGSSVKPGDILLGIGSTGLHTNGYSLARKVLFQQAQMSLDDPVPVRRPGDSDTLKGALLAIHTSYVNPILGLLEAGSPFKALAHITGGGLLENVPRVLPTGVHAVFDPSTWVRPGIFDVIREKGNVPLLDMYRTFNMGIGLVIAVAPHEAASVSADLKKVLPSLPVAPIGQIAEGEGSTIILGVTTRRETTA